MAVAARAPLGGLQIVRKDAWIPDDLQAKMRAWEPRSSLGQIVKDCFQYLPAEMAAELLDRVTSCVVLESNLCAVVFRSRESRFWSGDRVEDWGEVGHKVITTAGVGFLVDAWQNSVELENQKYHALGTGTGAEASGDTALGTELSTEYTGNVRATGSLTEGASANIFKTVGTNTLDSGTPAVTEHGIFDQSATGGGTLWDRTKFSAINLDGTAGDGLATTYQMTASAGG